MESKNIYQRINAVMKDQSIYIKRGSAGQGTGVLYDEVIAKLAPLLASHGIVVAVDFIADQSRQGKNGGYIYEGLFNVHYINCDNPEDRLTCQIVSHSQDSGDKAPGKAITYAAKISHLKVFGIESGLNDESRADSNEFSEAEEALKSAGSLEELQAVFVEAYKSHSDTKTRLALTEIKNNMKKALSEESND